MAAVKIEPQEPRSKHKRGTAKEEKETIIQSQHLKTNGREAMAV